MVVSNRMNYKLKAYASALLSDAAKANKWPTNCILNGTIKEI